MFIKKYDCYELNNQRYYSFKIMLQGKLRYLTLFLTFCFFYIKRKGVLEFIANIDKDFKGPIVFEEMILDYDDIDKKFYFIESEYDYIDKSKTDKIDLMIEKEEFINLCQINFLDYMTLSKQNFINILVEWDKILNKLPPFVLLYLDDQDWYDLISFDSQGAMEKFIADHTE